MLPTLVSSFVRSFVILTWLVLCLLLAFSALPHSPQLPPALCTPSPSQARLGLQSQLVPRQLSPFVPLLATLPPTLWGLMSTMPALTTPSLPQPPLLALLSLVPVKHRAMALDLGLGLGLAMDLVADLSVALSVVLAIIRAPPMALEAAKVRPMALTTLRVRIMDQAQSLSSMARQSPSTEGLPPP